MPIELGLISFADVKPGTNAKQRLADLLEEITLADQLGLDVFGIGEHHRPDYAVSSPATILAAAAMVTKNIKLSSAVTVLSSDDPVRVFQDFATVDLLSEGRAEIMAGRGSFTESFPLFGYNLEDYDELFTEKLDLLLTLNKSETLTWKGQFRPSINNRGVYPRPFQSEIPIWLAAGGTPASAVRAATLGLPLILAIIGGQPQQFAPFIKLYRQTWEKVGRNAGDIQVGINNHLFIGEDSKEAADKFYPYYAEMMNRVGASRGWPPLSREQFEMSRSTKGALMVGSAQEIIDKILAEYELFGFSRFLAQASIGNVPHKLTMKSIEIFGTKVATEIKKYIKV
ncbi:MAG: LLM class flavin-dependent oxidoreductase [Ginsengibacter sp.]